MQRWSALALGVFGCMALGAIGSGLITGCLPEQERTPYGPPSSLGNYELPTPTGAVAAPPPVAADGDGGAVDPAALCNGAGPIYKTGDACAKSWKTDIFPLMQDQGVLKCGNATCHGPPSTQAPIISNDDPSVAWGQLTAFTNANLNNKKYIDVCSKDDQTSSMTCNILGGCGTAMPEPGVASTIPAPDTWKADVKTWLQCGAPNN